MFSKKTSKLIIFFILSFLLLTFEFHKDTWDALVLSKLTGNASTDDIEDRSIHRPSEGWQIMGKLAKSRQDGIFSSGGLLGAVGPIPEGKEFHEFQTDAYYDKLPFSTYHTYKSRIGFEGVTYSLFDKFTSLPPAITIFSLWLINNMLFSLVLSTIIVWFYLEFGFLTAITVFISSALSQWLRFWAEDLIIVMWSFYLPFIVSLFALRLGKTLRFQMVLIFTAVLVKSMFSGYDLIIPALTMAVAPYIYYSIYERWHYKIFLQRIVAVSSIAFVSVFSSLLILIFQIGTDTGSMRDGLTHIVFSLGKRGHGDPAQHSGLLAESLNASIYEVIGRYCNGTIINLNTLFGTSSSLLSFTYLEVILLFLLVSFLVLLSYKFMKVSSAGNASISLRQMLALCLTTWFVFLGSIMNFIFFKAAAYIHLKENYLAWHMPFTLYGFALVGMMIHYLYADIFASSKKSVTEHTR